MWDFDFNYDDMEDEEQSYNFDFGSPQLDFSSYTQPRFDQNTTPKDMYDIQALYNIQPPEYKTDAADQYGNYIKSEPTRQQFQPSIWRRLGSGLMTALDANQRGVAAGFQSGQQFRDIPYNRAREEWTQRARQMGEGARIEQQRNQLARQNYESRLRDAMNRFEAQRRAKLADNTLATGEVTRDNMRDQMRLRPLASFTNEQGDLTQYNKYDPTQRTLIGRTNADTPGARDSRQRLTLAEARRRAAMLNEGANLRNERTIAAGDRRQTERLTAEAERIANRPPEGLSPNEQLNMAYRSAEFNSLKAAGVIGHRNGGSGPLVFNPVPVNEAIQKAKTAPNSLTQEEFILLRDYEKFMQLSDPTWSMDRIVKLGGG